MSEEGASFTEKAITMAIFGLINAVIWGGACWSLTDRQNEWDRCHELCSPNRATECFDDGDRAICGHQKWTVRQVRP